MQQKSVSFSAMQAKLITDILLTFDDGSTEHLMKDGEQLFKIRAKELLQRYVDPEGQVHDTKRTIVSLGQSFAFVLPPVEPAEGIHIIEDVPDKVLIVN